MVIFGPFLESPKRYKREGFGRLYFWGFGGQQRTISFEPALLNLRPIPAARVARVALHVFALVSCLQHNQQKNNQKSATTSKLTKNNKPPNRGKTTHNMTNARCNNNKNNNNNKITTTETITQLRTNNNYTSKCNRN